MDPTITLRPAKLDDAEAINTLHNEAISEGFQEWETTLPTTHHETLLIRMEERDFPFTIAETRNGTIIAYGLLRPAFWEQPIGNVFSATFEVVVSQQYRRQGLGRRIWTSLDNEYNTQPPREIYRVSLDLLSCNESAIAFVEGLGFSSDGSLDQIAVKGQKRFDLIYYCKFIGSAPPTQGKCFPSPKSIAPIFRPSNPPQPLTFRDANLTDIPFLTDIYCHYIINTFALNYLVPKPQSAREAWLKMLLDLKYPCLICEIDDRPVGYVSLTPFAEENHQEQCFLDTTLISVYFLPGLIGHGFGPLALEALQQHPSVKARKVQTVLADVLGANGPGMKFAMKNGFKHKVKRTRRLVKFGEYVDVHMFQLDLA